MNYRHAFHAGNFADVLKHAVLALILSHLRRKDAPFRVIDTHAGIGLYDLEGDEASRTGEWRGGIGRLDEADIPAGIAERLAPYLTVVGDIRRAHGPFIYPGSPEISRRLTRAQDRVVLIEKHPEDAALLAANMKRDQRVKVVELDGWTALKAYVPPPEKRGVVLIDPPFEEAGELARMARGVTAAWSKWRTGIYRHVVSDQGPARHGRFCGRTGRGPVREDAAHRADADRRRGRDASQRLRPDRDQSALDARRRSRTAAAMARRDAWAKGRRTWAVRLAGGIGLVLSGRLTAELLDSCN